MIGEIDLGTKSICIPLASIFTNYLPKGQFRLLKIFQTQAISHISSQNHQVMIGVHIHKLFAEIAIQISKPKNIPNSGNQPYFFTKSPGHDWHIGIDLFQVTNRLLGKAITLNIPLSKPVLSGNCMLARDPIVNHKF